MLDPLKQLRIGRWPLVLLACLSGVATAIILAGAHDPTDAQLAAMAALKGHRVLVVDRPAASAPSVTPASGPASPEQTSSGPDSTPASGSSSDDTADSGTDGAAASGDDSTPTTTTATTTTTGTTTTPTNAGLPHVGHVFLIALSTPAYADAFGHGSQATYLRSLEARGTVLSGFHSLGRAELPDLLAMVSGQAPNADTTSDCASYVPFPAAAVANAAGIVAGRGCVYPDTALTIADQATSAGESWGAFVADTGTANCPVPNTGVSLATAIGGTGAGYDLRHNPFAFFGSLLDAGACSSNDQDLTALPKALRSAKATPAFTYLGADACADGDPQLATAVAQTSTTATTTTPATTTPTTPATTTTTPATTTAAAGCPDGSPAGVTAEDAFLKTWVPQILASPAYRKNGVLVIAFAGDGGAADARTGALVLSRWTRHGKTVKTAYSPYSLLHSIEDMLGYQPLAHAAKAPAFAKAVL